MTRGDLQWLDIEDFTPGIVHELGPAAQGLLSGYGPGSLGMATLATKGCIALERGGLGPLPSMDWNYTRPAPTRNAGVWTPGDQVENIRFSSFGPVVIGGEVANGSLHPVELIFSFFHGSEVMLERDKVWKLGGTVSTITGANVDSLYKNTLVNTTSGGATYFVNQTTNPTDPTAVGNPATIIGALVPVTTSPGFTIPYFYAFPDPTNPTSVTPADLSTGARMNNSGIPVAHQNRIIILTYRTVRRGTTTDGVIINDKLFWSQPNTWVLEDTKGSVFGPEEPVGYGAWASLTSSDLLLIKHRDGAILIQSDINYPIVRKLPGVTSTAGQESDGSVGPGGFAYLVGNDGVYLHGGESSRLISPQLPSRFWDTYSSPGSIGKRPQLAWWGDWLLVPNGFLFDASTGGWWRLDNRTTYMWQIDPFSNYAYGLQNGTTIDGSGKLSNFLFGYNRTVGTNTYTWESQPLFQPAEAQARRNRIREIVIVAQADFNATGSATLTLTVQNADGSSFSPAAGTVATGNRPQVLRFPIAARDAMNARVKVVATGNGTDPAPVIYFIRVGWEPAQHVAPG